MISAFTFNITDPDETAASGALAAYWYVPFNITIVGVSAAPLEDDAGADIDINDDGTAVISAVDASDKDAPGTWLSTHLGGSNSPVHVAAGSELTIDVNDAAAANRFDVVVYYLAGSALA